MQAGMPALPGVIFGAGHFDDALSTFEKLIDEYPESAIIPVTQLMVKRVQLAKDNEKLKRTANNASDSGVIIDQKTGVKYTRTRTFTGKRDVIEYPPALNLSSNGKFLLWNKLVIPLDDGEPFDLVDMSAERGSFSPDGKKVVFRSGGAIWVIPVSPETGRSMGSAKKLLDGDYWTMPRARWSPDSERIVFERREKEGDSVLWIIPIAGGDPFLLELDVSVTGKPVPLSLSPDRRKLLFSIKRSEDMEDLWVIPVSLKDGQTTGPAVMVFSGSGGGEWSPDGTRIAVIHRSDIWIAFAEGSEPVQLTKTPERKFGLHWVPGGEMIAYRAYHSQEEQPLMLISASGGAPRKVLDVPKGYAWSPDVKELAFVSERFIMITPVAGGEAQRIVDLKEPGVDEANYGLCWSPDGRKLAFASYNRTTGKPGPGPIFVVSAEGGEVTRLATDDSGQKDYLYWSPDGKWISYNSDAMVKTSPEGAIWEADVS
jgi:Tol biopolymer transport system component